MLFVAPHLQMEALEKGNKLKIMLELGLPKIIMTVVPFVKISTGICSTVEDTGIENRFRQVMYIFYTNEPLEFMV
jgi:hypothetical protein